MPLFITSVTKANFTANGTSGGVVTVASTAGFAVGATVYVTGNSLSSLECIIVSMTATTMTLRRTGTLSYGVSDLSAYTTVASSAVTINPQSIPGPGPVDFGPGDNDYGDSDGSGTTTIHESLRVLGNVTATGSFSGTSNPVDLGSGVTLTQSSSGLIIRGNLAAGAAGTDIILRAAALRSAGNILAIQENDGGSTLVTVDHGGTLTAANLVTNGSVNALTVWAPNSNSTINLQARGTANHVKIGNASALSAGDTIAGFYSDNGTTLKLSVMGDGKIVSPVASGSVALQIEEGARIKFGSGASQYLVGSSNDQIICQVVFRAEGGFTTAAGLRNNNGSSNFILQANFSDAAGNVAVKLSNGTTLTNSRAYITGFYNDNNAATLKAAINADGMFQMAMGTPQARPAADANHRGMIWFTKGGVGVPDTVAICAKKTDNTYDWFAMATIP